MATNDRSSRQSLDLDAPMGSAPHLSPIPKPKGLRLKLLYRVLARQFGKTPSWLTVFSARVPFAYTSWMGKVYSLNKKLALSSDTATLVREHVNALNTCTWCSDAGRWSVTEKMPHLLPKLDALHEYRASSLFDGKERAALDYATELTETKNVSPETFAQLSRHYSEREICEVVWVVATNHLFNLTNRGLNIGSDGLCELSSRSRSRSKSHSVSSN
jgi:alkylhydroperoxidase family enzyme